MFGKNRIVNKHGLKMVGLKRASGITKRTQHGRIFWDKDTGNVVILLPDGHVLKRVDDDEAKYKEFVNSLYGMMVTCSIRYNGPMTMQEIADAIYEEYREEKAWQETAEDNGWRVKE